MLRRNAHGPLSGRLLAATKKQARSGAQAWRQGGPGIPSRYPSTHLSDIVCFSLHAIGMTIGTEPGAALIRRCTADVQCLSAWHEHPREGCQGLARDACKAGLALPFRPHLEEIKGPAQRNLKPVFTCRPGVCEGHVGLPVCGHRGSSSATSRPHQAEREAAQLQAHPEGQRSQGHSDRQDLLWGGFPVLMPASLMGALCVMDTSNCLWLCCSRPILRSRACTHQACSQCCVCPAPSSRRRQVPSLSHGEGHAHVSQGRQACALSKGARRIMPRNMRSEPHRAGCACLIRMMPISIPLCCCRLKQ